jgi:hypothetical protein
MQILVNPFAILETAPEIVQRVRVGEGCRPSITRIAALEAATETGYASRVV